MTRDFQSYQNKIDHWNGQMNKEQITKLKHALVALLKLFVHFNQALLNAVCQNYAQYFWW